MKNFFTKSASISLTVILSILVVAGIVYAGNLTAPGGSPSAQSYTLSDIYTRLTTNATTTAGDHSLSTTTSPASSFYTLSQIYSAIPTIDPTKVLTGTTYLGVAGSASAGYTYPSEPLKTGQTTCYYGGSLVSCAGTGEDGETQNGIVQSYTDNSDGTITDNNTGLMWDKCLQGLSGASCATGSLIDGGYATLNQATSSCAADTTGGHSDWRLPNIRELITLIDYAKITAPFIDTTYFPNSGESYYVLSSSFYNGNPTGGSVWKIDLIDDGSVGGYAEGEVRCVRNLP